MLNEVAASASVVKIKVWKRICVWMDFSAFYLNKPPRGRQTATEMLPYTARMHVKTKQKPHRVGDLNEVGSKHWHSECGREHTI